MENQYIFMALFVFMCVINVLALWYAASLSESLKANKDYSDAIKNVVLGNVEGIANLSNRFEAILDIQLDTNRFLIKEFCDDSVDDQNHPEVINKQS